MLLRDIFFSESQEYIPDIICMTTLTAEAETTWIWPGNGQDKGIKYLYRKFSCDTYKPCISLWATVLKVLHESMNTVSKCRAIRRILFLGITHKDNCNKWLRLMLLDLTQYQQTHLSNCVVFVYLFLPSDLWLASMYWLYLSDSTSLEYCGSLSCQLMRAYASS